MQLIEISAWNDSGGGFLHRLFDGHPELDCWPFELLLGNDAIAYDRFSPDWFRGRFRWPRLTGLLPDNGLGLFDQISDGELKPVLLDAHSARHGQYAVPVSLSQWRSNVAQAWEQADRHDQASFITLYLEQFLSLRWPGRRAKPLLAHCPTIVLDANELWADLPSAKLIHVIRSPLAGYADMHRRHPMMTPENYALKWALINGLAATLAVKYPDRLRLVALDGLVHYRASTMAALCEWIGISPADTVLEPTWNGRAIDPSNMGPFGGVPHVKAGRDAELAGLTAPLVRQTLLDITLGARMLLSDGALSLSLAD